MSETPVIKVFLLLFLQKKKALSSCLATLLLPNAVGAAPPPISFPAPQRYSLGPAAVVSRPTAKGSDEEITVTATRPAPIPDTPLVERDSPRNAFNVGGNPMQSQADCQPYYTTVAGQPARPGDLLGPKGVRDCWF